MNRASWRRRLLIFLAMVLLFVGAGAASQAYADGLTDTLCKDVPKPKPPSWGTPGLLTAPKDLSTVPDQTLDPFAAGSTLRISDVYGWSAHYNVYDLGCGNSFLSDPAAVVNTNLANGTIEFEQTNLALLAGAEDIVKSDQLTSWLGDTLETITAGITPILFGENGRPGWLGLAILAAGLVVVWNTRKMGYAQAARVLGVVAGAIALTAFALLMPATMSQQLDSAVTAVARTATSTGVGNASPSDLINRESTYRTWLANNFGDATTKLATEQGPKLWAATHYSYSDMKAIAADPNARTKIDQLKATQFKQVADEIKKTDPAGYERFTGRADRNGSAVMGSLVSGLMSLFQWIALVMMAIARLMMPALVIAAPLLALVGVLQVTRGHTALASLWDMFTASIVAVAKFGIASAVMSLVMIAIFASDTLNPGWKVFLVIVLTVIALMITKPIRTFKTIIPGLDPNKAIINAGALTSLFGSLVAAKAGAGAALADAAINSSDEKADQTDTQADRTLPARSITMVHHDTPALPPPVFDQQASQRSVFTVQQVLPDSAARAESGWKGIVAAPAQAQLPGARAALPAGTRSDIDTGAASSGTGSLPRPIEPGGGGGRSATPPLPHGAENETPTIKPTGIFVDDGGVNAYVRLEDPQLDANGVEHTEMTPALVYQSPKVTATASAGGAGHA